MMTTGYRTTPLPRTMGKGMTPLQAKCGWWLMEPEEREAFAATLVALGIMSEAAAKALAAEPLTDPFNPQARRRGYEGVRR